MSEAMSLHDCSHSVGVSASQTLEEISFDKGIWKAALDGNEERIKKLITKDRNCVNARDPSGYTALHYSSRNGHTSICTLLLVGGASVNAQTTGGATPLHRAAYVGHTDIVKLLLKNNADVLLKDSDGKTALHKACEGGNDDIKRCLIECKMELKDIPDNKGHKPKLGVTYQLQ